MTQIVADTLGLPIESVTFRLGDSTLPKAPIQGGSFTAAHVVGGFAELFGPPPQLRRTSPVYPLPAIAGTAISLGSRRKLTASMDSVKTSLTFGGPRSLT